MTSNPAGRLMLRPGHGFNGMKVFSATLYKHRSALGETVTGWIAAHRHLLLVDVVVSQSSDAEFHCLSIVISYWEPVSNTTSKRR